MAKQYLVAVGIVEDDERIALVLNRWPVGDAWSIPGGQLNLGETLTECVVREIQEETGLLVAPVELVYVVDSHDQVHDLHFLTHVFSCRVVTGELRPPTGDEFVVDARWVTREEVARYVTWPILRDPLLAYLAGHEQRYWMDRDAYRPEDGKGPGPRS